MYSRAISFVIAAVCCSAPLVASPVLTPQSGSLIATAVLTNGSIQLDVRGSIVLGLVDLTNSLPLTNVAIADIAGGTDLNGSVIPFGNAFLIASTAATSNTNTTDLVFFNFAGASFNRPVLTIPAFFAARPMGNIPDPALLDLILNSPIPFNFTFSSSQTFDPQNVIAQFTLSANTPEPSAFSLMAVASVLFTVVSFRNRWKAAPQS